MTLSIDRLSLAENKETPVSRGQELYDLAQTALMGFNAGKPPEGVSAVYGEAAGDVPEGEYYVTPGLNVVIEGLGTISVQRTDHYSEVHVRSFADEKNNEHHYLDH